MNAKIGSLLLVAVALSGTVSFLPAEPAVLRVGFFPNVTHAHGVIGSDGTHDGGGWFEQRLGADVTVQWYAFNAGPSAMEAVLAGSIDLTYVGPNPALNAYIRSRGEEIRILAGATLGGAALVVPAGSPVREAADFRGRRLATPQLGNTQDVAARAWLTRAGLRITLTGGDAQVVPTANPDQLALFKQGKLDGVWTVEPWVARLELEGGGRVLLEQPDAITTLLVARVGFLREQPALAAAFRRAHGELTEWINAHPEAAREAVRRGLGAQLRREMPAELIARAWTRLHFTDEVRREAFEQLVADAAAAGLLRGAIPLDRLFAEVK